MSAKRASLGRGLGALITEIPSSNKCNHQGSGAQEIRILELDTNPHQPRHRFDDAALAELTDSINEHGVLQPLVVRKKGTRYEIIAGERRYRAALAAKLETVPCIITSASDEKAMEIALVENLQREDLNDIEEARGYQELMKRFKMTQDQVAHKVGKARATVANVLRLLNLCQEVQDLVEKGMLSGGHAKVLAALETPLQRSLTECVVKDALSVRQLEKLAQQKKKPPPKPRPSDVPDPYLQDISDRLQQQLGSATRISPCHALENGKKVKGKIEIDYYSNDELSRLLEIFGISMD